MNRLRNETATGQRRWHHELNQSKYGKQKHQPIKYKKSCVMNGRNMNEAEYIRGEKIELPRKEGESRQQPLVKGKSVWLQRGLWIECFKEVNEKGCVENKERRQ
ncbi:hypothetical protein SUGI_0691160 [Cryptomeria japonica]|nr:hypothetical protein SUGI_0691160 [Cryptomeria japonica]